MAKKFLVPIDLSELELLNVRLQMLASAPTGYEAQVYYNSTTKRAFFHNGTTFVAMDGSGLLGAGAPGSITPDATAAAGASDSAARLDHTHGIDAGPPTANLTGSTTNAEGASSSFARADHSHAITVGGTPSTIQPDASANGGASATLARSDHTHAIVAAVPGSVAPGDAAAEGTSSSFARADHTHGVSAAAAGASAPGDTSTEGVSGSFARADHRHSREGYAVVGQVAATDAAAASAGSAAEIARGDHKHQLTVGNVTAQTTFGASSGNGTATSAARSDHVHGTPTHDGTAHSAVRIDQLAAPTADVSFNNRKITGLASPTADSDAANKGYVDAARMGMDVKDSVRVATTATTGTYNATGGTSNRGQLTATPNTVDGVTLAVGNRILVKDHTTPAANGIYTVTTVGTGANGVWDRAPDFDSDAEVTAGAYTFVEQGTANSDSGWLLTTDNPITIGGASGTALTWTQFSGAGQITAGAGLTKTGATIDVGAGSGITVNADDVALNWGSPTISTLAPGDAAAAGTATNPARSDHKHANAVAAPTTTITLATANGAGAAASFSRSDHTHALQQATAAPPAIAATGSVGASNNIARQDHTHAYPTDMGRKFAANVGDGAATSVTVTHNLNTRDVDVTVYSNSSPYDEQECDIEHATVNTVTLKFGVAPALNSLRAVVVG